ncbi:MAG: hypothetical protein KF782_25110 [Labilithrix sp.]|nr:hypothetical protein [Labilithrix sp.]
MLGAVARAQAPAATATPTTATPTTATPATEPDAPAAPIPPRPIASPPGAAATDGARGTAEGNTRLARDIETAPPPPSHVVYFQYGVAFATEQVLAPGPICDNTGVPCILGAGAGIVVRGGWRSTGPLYLGGAYELTKQDPNKLYRIALLQQARAEGRYYFMTARVTEPYASVGAGVAGYGNEWAIDTWGPTGAIGAGVEYQITRRTVVGLAFAYRLLYFSRFTDTAGSARNPGVAQLLGFDLVLEQRDAVVRAGADDARGR